MRVSSQSSGLTRSVLIVGAGTSGLMTACYLKKAFPAVSIRVLAPRGVPSMEEAATAPSDLQRTFFDFLEIGEKEWM